MKKELYKALRTVLILFICTLSLTGCKLRHITQEQYLQDIDFYEEQLAKMVEERGYDITELSEENGYEGYSTKEWLIKKDDMAYICVQIELETDGSGEGLERFWVSYNIEDSSNIGELFDLNFFVDIVNVFSGHKISLQMCEDIIMDLDNKYSLREEDVNYEGNVISRQNFLDYFENWTLTYTVDKSNWENLCFWGLTDNSTR